MNDEHIRQLSRVLENHLLDNGSVAAAVLEIVIRNFLKENNLYDRRSAFATRCPLCGNGRDHNRATVTGEMTDMFARAGLSHSQAGELAGLFTNPRRLAEIGDDVSPLTAEEKVALGVK